MLLRLNGLGGAKASAGYTPLTLMPVDDHFLVYTGRDRIIPVSEILANDEEFQVLRPLSLVSTSNEINGTTRIVGDSVIFTSTGAVGEAASFEYEVRNSIGQTNIGTVNLTVLEATLIPVIDYFDVYEGKTQTVPFAAIVANDQELEAFKPLEIVDITNVVNGNVVVDYPGQQVVFTSTGNAGEAAGFDYSVQNNIDQQATGQVSMNVLPVTIQAVQDTLDVFNLESRDIPISFLLQNDLEVQPLRPIVFVSFQNVLNGTVESLDADTIRFNSTAGPGIEAGFDYTIENNLGHRSTGRVVMNALDVPLTIVPGDDDFEMFDGYPVQIADTQLLSNDFEISRYLPLEFVSIDVVDGGDVNDLGGGVFEFSNTVPANDYVNFTYTVRNTRGMTAEGDARILVKPITLVANTDQLVVYENYSTQVQESDLILNDSEVAEFLPVEFVNVINPVGVSISNITDTAFTVTATGNVGELAHFDYVISNSIGHMVTGRVEVDVRASTLMPMNDTLVIWPGYPETVTQASLIANDTDTEFAPITFVGVSNEVNCTVTGSGNLNVSTIEPAGGTASFDYTVENSLGHQKTGTVTLDIQAFTIQTSPDAVSVSENQTVSINSSTLLANDTDTNSSLLPITLRNVSSGVGVDVSYNSGSGQILVTATGAPGPGSFMYEIENNRGHVTMGTVNVTITPQTLVANPDVFDLVQGDLAIIPFADLIANDDEIPALEPILFSRVFNPIGGTVEFNAGDNTVRFRSTDIVGNPASFEYEITNGQGDFATSSVTLNIQSPTLVAVPNNFSVIASNSITVTESELVANDTEVPARRPLSVVSVANPSGGLVTLNPDGSVTFDSFNNPNTTGTFTYTVENLIGHQSTTTVSIDITEEPNTIETRDDLLDCYFGYDATVTTALIVANDIEPNPAKQPLTFVSVGNPTGGTVNESAGVVTFTSDGLDFAAGAEFEYVVENAIGQQQTGTVNIRLINQELVQVQQLNRTAYPGQTVRITEAELLATVTDNVSFAPLTIIASDVPLIGGNLDVILPSDAAAGAEYTNSYVIENAVGHRIDLQVNYTALETALTATDDTYARFESTIFEIPYAQLTSNDTDLPDFGFIQVANAITVPPLVTPEPFAEVGCQVTALTSAFRVELIGLPGTQAEFTYTIGNNAGQSATGKVFIDILDFTTDPSTDQFATYTDDTNSVAISQILDMFRASPTTTYAEPLSLVSVDSVSTELSAAVINGPNIDYTSGNSVGIGRIDITLQDGGSQAIPYDFDVNIIERTIRGVADTYPIKLGGQLTITEASLLANDIDIDANLPLTITAVDNFVNGNAVLNAGSVVFTSSETDGVPVDSSFTYTVENVRGHAVSVPVTLTPAPFTISGTNYEATMFEADTLRIPKATLIAQFTDIAENLPLTFDSIDNVSAGTGSITELTDDIEIVTEFTNGAGTSYSADFTVRNAFGHRETISLAIDVVAQPLTLSPAGDTFNVYPSTTRNILFSELLANDFEELDKKPLEVTGVTNVVGGAVVVNANSIDFTPSVNVGEPASLIYTVRNNIGQTANVSVDFNVVPVTLSPVNDQLNIFEGFTRDVPFSVLLANDVEVLENRPLTVTAISNVTGGNAVLLSDKVEFTSTDIVGNPAFFDYTVRNAIGQEATGTVTFLVETPPQLIAQSDSFSVQQGGTLFLVANDLLLNDSSNFNPVQVISVQNERFGNVSFDGVNITFTSTGLAGDAAGFEYTVRDASNAEAIGEVFITITELPAIEALLFNNTEQFDTYRDENQPPTAEEVFNTWARFDNNTYFDYGQPASGAAAQWQYVAAQDLVETTANTATHTGFISPEQLDTYVFEATFSSSNSDDDMINLVLAFENDGPVNRILTATRTANGANNWGPGIPNWCIVQDLGGTHGGTSTTAGTILPGNIAITEPPSSSWSVSGVTRVRVERSGFMFKAWCSQFGSTTIDPSTLIEWDVRDYPDMAWVGDQPQYYGYSAMSQQNATFTNISLVGGFLTDRVYDLASGLVYVYNSQTFQWDLVPGVTIADELGFPRTVTNPETGQTFRINFDKSITLIS